MANPMASISLSNQSFNNISNLQTHLMEMQAGTARSFHFHNEARGPMHPTLGAGRVWTQDGAGGLRALCNSGRGWQGSVLGLPQQLTPPPHEKVRGQRR